jgi:hypothetical protein
METDVPTYCLIRNVIFRHPATHSAFSVTGLFCSQYKVTTLLYADQFGNEKKAESFIFTIFTPSNAHFCFTGQAQNGCDLQNETMKISSCEYRKASFPSWSPFSRVSVWPIFEQENHSLYQ